MKTLPMLWFMNLMMLKTERGFRESLANRFKPLVKMNPQTLKILF
ncbi:MAG: hypothetical protein Q4G03_07870 [Planctomycetia bacterium]|nr:hypothetical protein [Planctomycetia bacterium]